MTADNFDRILNELVRRTPFQVFTVELHGGRRFEVDHPRALVNRDGVAVFVAPGGYPIGFDHESVNQILGAPAGTMRRKETTRAMTHSERKQETLRVLSELVEHCPDVRFGPLIVGLSGIARGPTAEAVWDLKDDELLAATKRHLEDDQRRHAGIA